MARSRCKKNAPLHGRKRIPGILKPYANLGKNGKFPVNIRVEAAEGEAEAGSKKAGSKKAGSKKAGAGEAS